MGSKGIRAVKKNIIISLLFIIGPLQNILHLDLLYNCNQNVKYCIIQLNEICDIILKYVTIKNLTNNVSW